MALRPRRAVAVRAAAGGRPDTHRHASSDHPGCRATATCVRDQGRCAWPAGRRDRSSVPGCEAKTRGLRGSLAGRKGEEKKSVSCVTTRGGKLRGFLGLTLGFGALAALPLGLSVLGSDLGILASRRLPPRGLPAADLATAFRLLTIALIPGPRFVLAPTPFAQADPRACAARSSRTGGFPLNLGIAHGRLVSHGKGPGRMCYHPPRAYRKRTRRLLSSLKSSGRTRQRSRRR